MPKIAALGGLSSRGFGEFAQQTAANYIEDVFSTYLYTGNGSTQTITNGIDLAGKGGLVWIKGRGGVSDHILQNNLTQYLSSNTTAAASDPTAVYVTAFNASGFSLGFGDAVNKATSPGPYASWTFRKQPKFFDIVQYNGNGGTSQTINHNLGSTPGMMIIKRIDTNGYDWVVYHQSLGNSARLSLNLTSSTISGSGNWNDTSPTSTQFTVGNSTLLNASGGTYIAYLFAHNAGGFGADGSQNVISCGSFTCDASGNVGTVSLGYEPQYILFKKTNAAQNWQITDTMRGMSLTNQQTLNPNLSDAEGSWPSSSYFYPTATGFAGTGNFFGPNAQVVYMAIRRGPMKTPTDATKVFSPSAASGVITTGFPVDLNIVGFRAGLAQNAASRARLIGGTPFLVTSSSSAEATGADIGFASNTGLTYSMSANWINWNFQRAPGFFDVVCYTGNGASTQTINHNLGVVPEMMIVKRRDVSGYQWGVYNSAYGPGQWTLLNSTASASVDNGFWGGVSPTATQFTVGNYADVNASGSPYVCYLFASCSGVSKVGTYTGTGTGPLTINCGFTAGARFVLIKTWDSTGGWYVYDTARGMSSGNDPYLLLNSTSAEVTTTDYVDTTPSGFIVNLFGNLNIGGFKYIYLAIA